MELEPFETTFDEQARVLGIRGEIDEVSGPRLREAVTTYSESFTRDLSVDLSEVTYLPSMGIGVLAVAMKNATQAGSELDLVAAEGTVAQRVLNICRLPYRTS